MMAATVLLLATVDAYVPIGVAIFASVTAPLILNTLATKRAASEHDVPWAREDEQAVEAEERRKADIAVPKGNCVRRGKVVALYGPRSRSAGYPRAAQVSRGDAWPDTERLVQHSPAELNARRC